MSKPKTLKLVVKGEVPACSDFFELPDGSIVEMKRTKKVVVPSKKNQQRLAVNKVTLKPIVMASKQHEGWIKDNFKAFLDFKNHIVQNHEVSLPITRAKIKVLFFFATSSDKDLSNKFETIADMLVDVGIIANDSFKVLNPVVLQGWVNRERPRTEIYITILKPLESPKEYEWDITPESYFRAIKDRKNLRKRLLRQKAIHLKPNPDAT